MSRQLIPLLALASVALGGCKSPEPANETDTAQDNAAATSFGIGPILRASAAPVVEGNEGETVLAVKLSLSPKARTSVAVDYMTVDGTAKVGSDYRRAKGRQVFKPGETEKTIEIPVIADDIAEDDESFSLRLHVAEGATLEASEIELTILDDD